MHLKPYKVQPTQKLKLAIHSQWHKYGDKVQEQQAFNIDIPFESPLLLENLLITRHFRWNAFQFVHSFNIKSVGYEDFFSS